MPGLVEGNTPSYISSQSADVILSDVRPFKLNPDALHAINVFLDEFLYSILNNAGSLSTDKLRASLLSLLPTSLGKEALLEAEVELRAYWERTVPAGRPFPAIEDDSKTFHLHWAFELLRLKCEAYSTLNESDEDPRVEERIQTKFNQVSAVSPNPLLLAPAALYLTAILEAMCEHVLTNVGRVAARDSSRTSATINDLFTALCEDDSIYGLFRSMRVYEQIELLSKDPVKSRRSKSFSRNELATGSRSNSLHQELSLGKDSFSTRGRASSEVSSSTTVAISGIHASGSRTSLEKVKAMKIFVSNGKASTEGETQVGHQKSDSSVSEKHMDGIGRSFQEDMMYQQEFDDLMRSSSTMKVSLTPDRLKTMEMYKQDKERAASRRPVPLTLKKDTDSISSAKRPSLRHVDSVIDEDEELAFPQPPTTVSSRKRQGSAAPPPSSRSTSARARTNSASAANSHTTQPSRPPPIQTTISPINVNNMTHATANNGFPPRTRKKQRNRESLDLDDIMGGSDDDISVSSPPPPSMKSPTSRKSNSGSAVSAATRELMDFLASGPPDDPHGASNGLANLMNDGPNYYNASTPSFDTKPKGDRLRRMISKLSMSNGKTGAPSILSKTPTAKHPPLPIAVLPTPPRPPLSSQASLSGLSSLANRPIPPRLPRPRSPSPLLKEDSSPPSSPNRLTPSAGVPTASKPSYSITNSNHNSAQRSPSPVLIPPRKDSRKDSSQHLTSNGSAHNANGNALERTSERTRPAADKPASRIVAAINEVEVNQRPSKQTDKVATGRHNSIASTVPSGPTVGLCPSDVQDLHRLISSATTADECRLILDMLIAGSKIPVDRKDKDVPSSTSASPPCHAQTSEDDDLERSLVDFFLGGSSRIDRPRLNPDELYPQSSGVDAK